MLVRHAEGGDLTKCCCNIAAGKPFFEGCGQPAVIWRESHDVTGTQTYIDPLCKDHLPKKVSTKKMRLWKIVDHTTQPQI